MTGLIGPVAALREMRGRHGPVTTGKSVRLCNCGKMDCRDGDVLQSALDEVERRGIAMAFASVEMDHLRSQLAEAQAELKASENFSISQSKKLSEIVNLVRGAPPENVLWSTHDVVERVRATLDSRREREERVWWLSINTAIDWVNLEEHTGRIQWTPARMPNQTTAEDGLRWFCDRERMNRDLASLDEEGESR